MELRRRERNTLRAVRSIIKIIPSELGFQVASKILRGLAEKSYTGPFSEFLCELVKTGELTQQVANSIREVDFKQTP